MKLISRYKKDIVFKTISLLLYFLKLSRISLATSFPHKPKAIPHAIVNIAIKPVNIVLVISVAIPTFDKTAISVKNNITTFAPQATIFDVFCLDIFNA